MKKTNLKLAFVLLGVMVMAYIVIPHILSGDRQMTSNAIAAETTTPVKEQAIDSLRDLNNAFINLARDIKPSVVTVFTEKTLKVKQNPFGFEPFSFFNGPQGQMPEREYRQQGMGSGIIVSTDGNILTNNHVVAEADSIYVRTIDNKRYAAKVIGTDPKTDIAVIKIEAQDLKPIKIGDSDKLQVGEIVLAVGSPMSENLAHTVTQGIVSAKGRSNMGLADYEDFIQTDAAINPGNSGGALVNLDGELIGVNSAIFSKSGGFQGIGFAVPSNMALSIMNSLLTSGKIVRGWLGVSIQDINEDLADAMGLKEPEGALIGDVLKDSPATKAGIEPGDIIVGMEDKPIINSTQLRNTVAGTLPGTKVKFHILRDSKEKDIDVTLGELPGDDANILAQNNVEDKAGFTVTNPDRDLMRKYKLNADLNGAVVTDISQESSAYQAGLREGDLIRSIDRQVINDANDVNKVLEGAEKGEKVLLRINRQDQGFYIVFTL